MKKIFALLIGIVLVSFCYAQEKIEIYPSNWWIGMKWNKVQLMLHGDQIGNYSHSLILSKDAFQSAKIRKVENLNYLFIDLIIKPNAKP
jgi:hypothetical protein